MNTPSPTRSVPQPSEVRPAAVIQRVPELDGLRGLAIVLVVICHYLGNAEHKQLGFLLDHLFTILSVGWSGVDLFFVLSGFLIGGILLDSRSSPHYFRAFYLRRIHRILPVYYSWILLYLVVGSFLVFAVSRTIFIPPGQDPITPHDLSVAPRYFLFLQNIFYSPSKFEWIWFVVTWSLAIEEQFYLVAPPLIRYLSIKGLVIVLSSTLVIAPILRSIAYVYFPQLDHFYQFAMPCRADALSLGILAAVAWRWKPFRKYLQEHPVVLQRTTIYLFVILVGLLWWLARPANLVTVTIGYSSIALFYASFLLLVLTQTSSLAAHLIRADWLRALGGISYCVYLIHLTINQLAHRVLLQSEPRIHDVGGVLVTFLAALTTWLVASFSWKFLEKPLIRRGHRFGYWGN